MEKVPNYWVRKFTVESARVDVVGEVSVVVLGSLLTFTDNLPTSCRIFPLTSEADCDLSMSNSLVLNYLHCKSVHKDMEKLMSNSISISVFLDCLYHTKIYKTKLMRSNLNRILNDDKNLPPFSNKHIIFRIKHT